MEVAPGNASPSRPHPSPGYLTHLPPYLQLKNHHKGRGRVALETRPQQPIGARRGLEREGFIASPACHSQDTKAGFLSIPFSCSGASIWRRCSGSGWPRCQSQKNVKGAGIGCGGLPVRRKGGSRAPRLRWLIGREREEGQRARNRQE